MEIRLCDFSRGDELAAAHAVQRAAYEVEAALIGSRGMPGLRESREGLLAASLREQFFGCFEAGRLAGVMALEVESDGAGGRWLRISRLAVDPAFFRRGVGRLLVGFAKERAAGGVVRVSTGAANAPGVALYASEGFVEVERYCAPDGTAMVMLRLG